MATSILDQPPSDASVRALLGRAHPAFLLLARRKDGSVAEWKRYARKAPWVLKVAKGERTCYYLQPDAGVCHATVVLGARAAEAALNGAVPASLHDAIRQARPYVEGRPVRVPVRTKKDAAAVERLLRVKLGD